LNMWTRISSMRCQGTSTSYEMKTRACACLLLATFRLLVCFLLQLLLAITLLQLSCHVNAHELNVSLLLPLK
jgi:hypothetical protein